MYSTVLLLHSWLRWAVILAGLFALVRGMGGWSGVRAWTRVDERAGFWFVATLDLQVLIGLVLYFFLSPLTTGAFEDFGGAMRNSVLRFWAVEHTFGMIVGAALAHIGRVRSRRAPAARKHRTAAIFYGLALLAILVSIPWPGMPAGRALFGW
ncbi:MAG: hypothetical protein H0T05_04325 [Acidobacteria bacterium]|nr:hypothetical protein [Acidobacteriota bacterium]MBA3885661.1 hypothetical protein [Acidobacteriota bacterium]